MPRSIQTITGPLEIGEYAPQGNAGAQLQQIINGWLWWMPIVIKYRLNNSAGAAGATPAASIVTGAGTVWSMFDVTAIAPAQSQQVLAALLSPFNFNASLHSVFLAFVPIYGEGTFSIGWTGGDANTITDQCTIRIVGKRTGSLPGS